ncbi:helix-turn-helix domain-containing protein [Actinomadura atramentaria]|uniref:helix-turn-helix domain-containing protein n=1 Tax=Actinomadura atramentaria TaxID=1990 RepID=UPI00037F4CE0|nr:helix-turn-helix domain-containing protein [Actinomadura atramentaria]
MRPDLSNVPELLTTGEVARLFRVSPQTVVRWARTGQIPVVELPGGRVLRYPAVEVRRLLGALGDDR